MPSGSAPILLAIPNLGWIKTGLMDHVLHVLARGDVDLFMPVGERPVAYAKNLCVEKFLAGSWEYLWFVDSDTVPPAYALDRLLAPKVDIISGVVRQHKRDTDEVVKPVPMVCSLYPEGMRAVVGKGVAKIDACGAGCLLIHRRVFDILGPPPWFEQASWGKHRGSDFNFCEKLRDADIQLRVNFDVDCLHYKEVGF